jgi:hypothetical protein
MFYNNEFVIKAGIYASGLERFVSLANVKGWGRPAFVIQNCCNPELRVTLLSLLPGFI